MDAAEQRNIIEQGAIRIEIAIYQSNDISSISSGIERKLYLMALGAKCNYPNAFGAHGMHEWIDRIAKSCTSEIERWIECMCEECEEDYGYGEDHQVRG